MDVSFQNEGAINQENRENKMDIEFECGECGQKMVVEDAGSGMTIRCAGCGGEVVVPYLSSNDDDFPIRIWNVEGHVEPCSISTVRHLVSEGKVKLSNYCLFGEEMVTVGSVLGMDERDSQWSGVKIELRKNESEGDSSTPSDKRIAPALILWFFLGVFGVHQFYLGNIRRGALYVGCLLFGIIGSVFDRRGEESFFTTIGTFALVCLVGCFIFDLIRIVTGNGKDGDGRAVNLWV